MTAFLLALPTWVMCTLILGAFTVFAVGGTFATRALIVRSIGDAHNDVGGFIFAAVAVVYAVLLAFTVFAVWEQYVQAENDITDEAATLVSLYRDTGTLNPVDRAVVRDRIRNYTHSVIDDEYPTMQYGEASNSVGITLNQLFDAYGALRTPDAKAVANYQESLGRLNNVAQKRELRLRASAAKLPDIFYFVLVLGGLVTIAFSWLFHMGNLRMQALMAGLLGVVVGLMLFLIIATDHPFTGQVAIGSDSLVRALAAYHVIDQN